MEEREFDKFAEEYWALHDSNVAISGESPEYFSEYKIKDLKALAIRHLARCDDDVVAPAILDFGAGVGNSVPFIRKYLPSAQLTCLDVSSKSLAVGKARYRDYARFVQFDGRRIPFADHSFTVVFAACVFHHIGHDEHLSLLREFRRVLEPDGFAFIYEHNPYNPVAAHVVKTCPFDANARLITARAMRGRMRSAGFSSVKVRYRVFFPHPLRALRSLEQKITWLPLGAQYYALAFR
jgi:ubiquinone/menaquinone biosynthesis C-methylase UbiE